VYVGMFLFFVSIVVYVNIGICVDVDMFITCNGNAGMCKKKKKKHTKKNNNNNK